MKVPAFLFFFFFDNPVTKWLTKLVHIKKMILWCEFVSLCSANIICDNICISGRLSYGRDWEGADNIPSGGKFPVGGETSSPPKVVVLLL